MKNIHNISAGAGSGKTTRLVSIIADLVSRKDEMRCSPERMILTTFTKAAAKEFKERTAAELIKGGHLEEAVTLDAAMIGTVHSIAHKYITRYWYLCGMSPDITPVTDEVAKKMRDESLDAVVDPVDLEFFRKYSRDLSLRKRSDERGEDFWKKLLANIYEQTLLVKDKERFMTDMQDHSHEVWGSIFDGSRNTEFVEAIKKHAPEYIKICEVDDIVSRGERNLKQADVLKNLLKEVESGTITQRTLSEAVKEMGDKPFAVSARMRAEWEGLLKELFGKLQPALLGIIPVEATMIQECVDRICRISRDWVDMYTEVKRKEGVIDYSDMEALFLELLGRQEVLEDIRSSVDYLFVDEFQDSNQVQISIFEILSENVKQSWFVGDPKQSIYGFRGSNIELVNKFSAAFPEQKEDESSPTGFERNALGLSSEILEYSYRSHPELVKLSNEVFKEAFGSDLPENKIILKAGRGDYDTKYPTVHHFQIEGKDGAKKAKALADGIVSLLNGTYPYLPGKKVKPSDIAVLVKTNDRGLEVASALKQKGVPVSYVDTEFLDSAEVQMVLSILHLVSGNQDAKSVAELRCLIDDLGLKEVLDTVKNGEARPFWGGLREFVESVKTLSVVDCVDAVVARFDLYNFVSRWNAADVRRANIDLVRKVAREFDSVSATFSMASDMTSFLAYIQGYKPESKFNNEDAGVKVLTYHKSKGLQWNVVFLHDLSMDISLKESSANIWGLNGTLLVPNLPHDPQWLVDAMASNTELQELLTESPKKILGEQRRLLYVGLTRARDLVFTVGSGKNMPWIQTCCPTAEKKDYSKIANGEFDIWGVGINSLCSEYQYTKDEVKCSLASSQPSRIRNAGFDLSETAASDVYGHKYHSPSSYKDECATLSTSPEKLESLPPIYLNHSHIPDNEFGDCVHKIYALGSCPDKAKRLSVAERILDAYGLDAGSANDLIARFDDLCAYLRKTYGDPDRGIDHELPFVYQDDQGRVFSGSIDMVWKTKDSCVIVDYKTFSGTPETALKECADKHASQMKIYRDALAATGETVANVLILYPINGLIVKVN